MTSDAARDFARKRQGEGAGAAMVNRSLACLRRILHLAHEYGKVQHVPKIRMLKEPGPRRGFLEPEKFDELLAALPTHLRPLIAFLYWSGVRLSEALAIEWSQIDLASRLVRLHTDETKNAEPRTIPLAAPVVALLHEIEPKTGQVFDSCNLRTEWARACTLVGLGSSEAQESEAGHKWVRYNGLIVHDLRRSAVRNLVRAGATENVAMKISGHKTASVFRRYDIVSTEDVSAAMRAVETFALGNGHKVKLGKTSLRKPSRSTRKLLQAKAMGA